MFNLVSSIYLIFFIFINYIHGFKSSYKSLPSYDKVSSQYQHHLLHMIASTTTTYSVGERLILPNTIEIMMINCANAIRSSKADDVKLGMIDIPLPVTGGTELDDWPGGIRQKYTTLRPMLQSMMKALDFSESEMQQRNYVGESGLDDGIGIWEDSGISLCCFPTPDAIPLLIKMTRLNDNILVIVNNQFFLDPMSKEESKSFLASGVDVYKLDQLNMKGPGGLPCRGILHRQYPNQYVAARRLDNGDYVILQTYNDKPDRATLEAVFFEDSKIRDSTLSFTDKLKRFVPNFGN